MDLMEGYLMITQAPRNILLTEDNRMLALNFTKTLERKGMKVFHAFSKETALNLIEKNKFDLAFIDLDLEKEKAGFELIPHLKKNGTFTVILSGHSEDEYIEKGYDLQCDDYLVKPFTSEKIDRILKSLEGQGAREKFAEIIREQYITEDENMLRELKKIEESLSTDVNLYITGPTGTGKTTIGRSVHLALFNNDNKYVHVNCGGIQKNLIESELFGHVRGAFTGASGDKVGKILEADGGTLHLDEIGCMPLDVQEKFLLVLDNGLVTPVGGDNGKKKKSTFKLVYSTSIELEDLVSEGKFREDLFYKLGGRKIKLIPLKERPKDVELLLNKKIDEIRALRGYVVKKEAYQALKNYSWFGNVRELNNFFKKEIERKQAILRYEDLDIYIRKNRNRFSETETAFITKKQLSYIEETSLKEFREKQEIEIVRHFYEKCELNKKKTMEKLGMTQYLLDKYLKILEAENGK